jgi:Holliday junction resolvase RusA-like endonuclease
MKKSPKRSILLFSEKLLVKPLSVNEAWQGRKFKTDKYKKYEEVLLMMLPNINIDFDKQPLELFIEVGFSNKASDIDNVIKPFVDILQKKYEFNDKYIYRLLVEKKDVRDQERSERTRLRSVRSDRRRDTRRVVTTIGG